MEKIIKENVTKTYRIYCYSLDGVHLEKSEDIKFKNDLSAIEYAFKYQNDYFNIIVFRKTETGNFIRIAKIY